MPVESRKSDRFVAYYRVSTDRQGKSGLGLDAQRETLRQLLPHGSIAEFVEVESGRNPRRPELAKALAMCRTRRAELVIAKLDRLSRNQAFLMGLIDSGVRVRFCDLPQIPGAMGRFTLQQMAAVAELEAGLISERTKAALAAKVARDGQWRKGNRLLPRGIGQSAAARETRRRHAQMALDLAPTIAKARGGGAVTLRQIGAYLDQEGIPAPRGGQWAAASVQRLLAKIDAG